MINEIKTFDGFKEYLKNNNIKIEKGVNVRDWIIEQVDKKMDELKETKKQ